MLRHACLLKTSLSNAGLLAISSCTLVMACTWEAHIPYSILGPSVVGGSQPGAKSIAACMQ